MSPPWIGFTHDSLHLSSLCQDPLYKFEPVEIGGEIFAYCKEPGKTCSSNFSNRNHLCFRGFVFDMDVVTLDNGKPVTRILAECMPNIVQVSRNANYGSKWEKMDRWNTLLPGSSSWVAVGTYGHHNRAAWIAFSSLEHLGPNLWSVESLLIQYNTNILMLCYMTFQASGIIHILQRRPAKKVKHFVLLLQFIIGLSSTYLRYVSCFSGCWKYDQCKGPSIKERYNLAGLLTKGWGTLLWVHEKQLLPLHLRCLCRRAHSSALLWLCHDITPYLEYVKFIALTKHLQEIVYVGQSTDCPIKGFQRFSGVVLFSIYFLSTFLLFSNSFFFCIIILCLWKPSLSSLHYWQFNKDLNQHIDILTTTKNNRHIDILTKNPINTFALKTS